MSDKLTNKNLPLYESCCQIRRESKPKVAPPNVLEPYVKSAREECENVMKPLVGDYPQRISESFQSSLQFANESIDYLRDDKNQAARAAYITSIGFLGFLIGRRGLIRRTTFGLISAGAAAALCNPTLAKDYAEVSYALTKRKLTEFYEQYGDKLSYEDMKKIDWNIFSGKSDSSSK